MTAAVLLAVDEAKVNPGLLGFIVVALLGVATWLLLRSMTRHLRKVNFEAPSGAPHAGAEGDAVPVEDPATPRRADED